MASPRACRARFFRLASWGFPRQILMILADGDKTRPEILEDLACFVQHFGRLGREEVVAGHTMHSTCQLRPFGL
ncbi:MAG: hypothetical protein PVG25_04075 [Anaerolineae bacterium]